MNLNLTHRQKKNYNADAEWLIKIELQLLIRDFSVHVLQAVVIVQISVAVYEQDGVQLGCDDWSLKLSKKRRWPLLDSQAKKNLTLVVN